MNVNCARTALLFWILAIAASCTTAPTSRSPGSGEANTGACKELASTCHEHAHQSPLAHDCHVLGHSGNEQQCEARRDECRRECQDAVGGESKPTPNE